jgi:hypothetical protein
MSNLINVAEMVKRPKRSEKAAEGSLKFKLINSYKRSKRPTNAAKD